MEKIFGFLYRNYTLFVFLLLQWVALALLFQSTNPKQHSAYMEWVLRTSGRIHQSKANLIAYFNLQTQNDLLIKRNTELHSQVYRLSQQLRAYQNVQPDSYGYTTTIDSLLPPDKYIYHPCRVVNNSVVSKYNYIMLNVGSKQGVEQEMGLVSPSGVVGMVVSVSDNYALAMSLLNKNISISAKVLGKQVMGTLVWEGNSTETAALKHVPQHFQVKKGDTVVTSGYSSIFPEGFVIGRVMSAQAKDPDGFSDIKVKLSADFHTLDYLYLIRNEQKPELDSLLNRAVQPETSTDIKR
jgi:rod shape-determining protein MreC